MEQIETKFSTEKRSKAYKWRYELYRKLFYGSIAFIVLMMALLFWTLKGNISLQKEIDNKTLTGMTK